MTKNIKVTNIIEALEIVLDLAEENRLEIIKDGDEYFIKDLLDKSDTLIDEALRQESACEKVGILIKLLKPFLGVEHGCKQDM